MGDYFTHVNPVLLLFGLGSLAVIRLQIQQKAEPAAGGNIIPCQTSVCAWAINVSQRFVSAWIHEGSLLWIRQVPLQTHPWPGFLYKAFWDLRVH